VHCVSAKHGEYSDSSCTVKATKQHKGKFELQPAGCVKTKKGLYSDPACSVLDIKKGHPKGKFERVTLHFTSTASSATIGEVPAAGRMSCSSYHDEGEISSPSLAFVNQVFTGCEAAGHSCQNGAPGEIRAGIDAILIGTGEKGPTGGEPAAGEVWLEYVSPNGLPGYAYQLTCTGLVEARVFANTTGTVSGNINTPATTSSQLFGPGIGEQALQTELNVGGGWAGPFATVYELGSTTTYGVPVEIRE
jgi:hypothetical protein